MPDNKFTNPYAGLKDNETNQIVVRVSKADYELIKFMHPTLGGITGMMGTLWQKTCNELRRRKITTVNEVDQFRHFIANCSVGISTGTADDGASETITIKRDDYQQLCLDSEQWQLVKLERDRGLRDRSADGVATERQAAKRTRAKGSRDLPPNA